MPSAAPNPCPPIVIQHSAESIIETTYFPAIKLLIENGNHYVAFSVMSSVIEVMGALFDDDDIDKENVSAKRFGAAIQYGFKPLGKGYEDFKDRSDKYWLYGGLRCGMLHALQPQKNIALTHTAESVLQSTKHLHEHQSKLVLVSEVLFQDIQSAWNCIKNDKGKRRSQDLILMAEYS